MGRSVNYGDLDFEQYGWKDADLGNFDIAEASADVVNRREALQHLAATNVSGLSVNARFDLAHKVAIAEAQFLRAEQRLKTAIRQWNPEAGQDDAV